MKTKITILMLLASVGLLIAPARRTHADQGNSGIYDDFDSNQIDSSKWDVFQDSGTTIVTQNNRVELTVPAAPSFRGATLQPTCILRGDFEVQVNYQLLSWPSNSGVRVGLGMHPGFGLVERVGADFFPDKEVYLTHFVTDGVQGLIQTSDQSGKLRLTRVDDVLSGYYFTGGSWALIHSTGVFPGDDFRFSLAVWHDGSSTGATAAFDDVVVSGQGFVCDVPYFDQRAAPWGGQEFNFASGWSGPDTFDQCPGEQASCIARWGCALSSVAMVLRFHDIDTLPNCSENRCPELVGLEIDPGSLNAWLKKEPDGYMDGGLLNWWKIETLAAYAGSPLEHGVGTTESELEHELRAGRPGIVDLKGVQHFAVAKGVLSSGSTFALNDPDRKYAPDLSHYDGLDRFHIYRRVGTDLSGQLIVVTPPIELLIVDAQGKRAGFDPDLGSEVIEFPGALYYTEDPIADDGGTEEASGQGIKVLYVDTPTAGEYTLNVHGGEGQDYEITFLGFDQDAISQSFDDSRTASAVNPPSYRITYDPLPGSPFAVEFIGQIDVKPGSDPNSINCNNKSAVITVALLTTETFDALSVDHETVSFESATELHVDKRTGEPKRHEEDIDGDGDIDLVFHFLLEETTLTCESTDAVLEGHTFDGLRIRGSDTLRMTH